MKHVLKALEAAAVAALAQAPAIAASSPVRHFIETHPQWAVYVPLAAGVAAWAYGKLKPLVFKPKTVPASTAPPAK
jgi:hypothetical protein